MDLLSALGNLVGGAGYVLDTPGALFRGALSGRPGERASGRDMLESWGALGANEEGLDFGDALGFGAELLADPLNLLMPLAGAKLGKAAMARGPMYSDGLATLKAAGVPEERLSRLLQLSPEPFSELPTGSKYLGMGADTTAFRTPAGDVAKIEILSDGRPRFGVPVSEDIVRPHRDVLYDKPQDVFEAQEFPVDMDEFGNTTWETVQTPSPIAGVRVQRVPLVDDIGQVGGQAMDDLHGQLLDQGLHFWDNHPGNVGMYQGRPVVVDQGAVDIIDSRYAPPYHPRHQQARGTPLSLAERLQELQQSADATQVATHGIGTAEQANPLMNRLLDMLGYTGYARREAAGQEAINPMMYGMAAHNALRPFGGQY